MGLMTEFKKNCHPATKVTGGYKEIISGLVNKFNYTDKLLKMVSDGTSENISGDVESIKTVNNDIESMIASIDINNCSDKEIAELNGFLDRLKQNEKTVKSINKPIFRTVILLEKETKADKKSEATPADKAEVNVNNLSKIVNKVSKKVNYLDGLVISLQGGKCEDPDKTKQDIKNICDEILKITSTIDHTKCNDDELKVLKMTADKVISANRIVDSINAKNSNPAIAAANNMGYGFNISNFIKQPQQSAQQPVVQGQPQEVKTVFPHQMCGLTQEQIVEEVNKHFKVIETLDAYPLYDLLQNKLLPKKMKELDSKQRANNPFLTQVKMDEYIGEPKLLEQYKLCFTMPCNDKKQLIVVLFNPVPVADKNGILQYPLHIFKAKKTAAYNNNNNNKSNK